MPLRLACQPDRKIGPLERPGRSKKPVSDKTTKLGLRVLAGASEKKWKKAEGKEAQLVGAQAKKVRVQCDKAFKEFLRIKKPQLTKAEYRVWREQVDLGIEDSARELTEILNNRMAQQGPLFGS